MLNEGPFYFWCIYSMEEQKSWQEQLLAAIRTEQEQEKPKEEEDKNEISSN